MRIHCNIVRMHYLAQKKKVLYMVIILCGLKIDLTQTLIWLCWEEGEGKIAGSSNTQQIRSKCTQGRISSFSRCSESPQSVRAENNRPPTGNCLLSHSVSGLGFQARDSRVF